jgi:hypothetical protein
MYDLIGAVLGTALMIVLFFPIPLAIWMVFKNM